jgi:hypothetical protein
MVEDVALLPNTHINFTFYILVGWIERLNR